MMGLEEPTPEEVKAALAIASDAMVRALEEKVELSGEVLRAFEVLARDAGAKQRKKEEGL